MQRVAIFQFSRGQRFALLLILAFSIFATSLFIYNNRAHAAPAATYSSELSSNIEQKIKALKYYSELLMCTQTAGYNWKTTISGDDIDKGPRWWINQQTVNGTGTLVSLGQYIDSWGDKNGLSNCNGESDSDPGWVNDLFSVFGLNTNKNSTGLEALGYTCSQSGNQDVCTNKDINSKTAKNGILYQALHGPYLNGVNPLTTQPDENAMSYYLALNALTTNTMCNAVPDGSANLVTVAQVQPDGTIKKSSWDIKNDGNGARPVVSGIPIIDNTDGTELTCQDMANATIKYAADYASWVGASACAAKYPSMATDPLQLHTCAEGRTNPTNYSLCISGTFSDDASENTKMKNACFIGQGLPIDKDGTTSGLLCFAEAYTDTASLTACINGSRNLTNPNYCSTTYPPPEAITQGSKTLPTDTNLANRKACTSGQALDVSGGGIPTDDSAANGGGANTNGTTTSCVIDGVGWIVCSVANFVASVTDGIYGLIQNLLKVPIINTNTTTGTNGVYNAWLIMRNFANVGFVIGFLIIIFSQITSLGVTNYGVKKTLPRLIVAVILVNVSYWLSAIAVDLSNITGSGIYDIMSGVKDSMNIGISSNWGNIIGGLLAGTGVAVVGGAVVAATGAAVIAAGGGMALVFLALPLVLSAVLAVLIAAFVLIARQALVVILIIISPLAFVALLLPNTEKLFNKWRSALVTLLLLYPIVSIVFGGAQIAGLAIMSTAGSTADPISTELPIVIGQTIMVVPFFILPLLITKFSGNNLSGLVSSMTSKGKGLISGIGGASRKEGRARMGTALNTMKYGENAPKGIIGRGVRRFGRSFDQTKDQRGMADSYLGEQRQSATRARLSDPDGKFATGAAAGSVTGGELLRDRAVASAEAEELKKALQPLMRQLAGMDPSLKNNHLQKEVDEGGPRAAAALQYAASIGDSGFMRQQIASSNDETKRQAFEAINANSGALLAKAPDLVKGSKAAFANVKGADLSTFTKDTAQAYMDHIGTISDPAELQTAINGFNSAVQDIANSPELQGKFSGDTGDIIIQHAIKTLPTSTLSSMSGMAKIDGNGKIR